MELPALDCHAHVSVSVTESQLRALGSAIVFSMTRAPAEAAEATQRYDRNLLWGCGAHPAYIARGGEVDLEQFGRRAKGFAVIGEVGLDRRSGNLVRQEEVFRGLLDQVYGEPVLISVHSAGCASETLQILRDQRHPGVILHWFTGSLAEAEHLLSLGSHFSVNTAMRRELLNSLPLERILPETDFPVAHRRTGTRPGDVDQLEKLLAEMHDVDEAQIRRQFYRNLRRLSVVTGAIDRMPAHVTDVLLLA